MNDDKEMKRFEAESDLRTLVEAARIKRDDKRRRAAMSVAREQRKALADLEKGENGGKA